jgi:hypothetical protein
MVALQYILGLQGNGLLNCERQLEQFLISPQCVGTVAAVGLVRCPEGP